MTNPDRDRSMRLKLAIEEMLKDIDMSGEEWNDHDKDGKPTGKSMRNV